MTKRAVILLFVSSALSAACAPEPVPPSATNEPYAQDWSVRGIGYIGEYADGYEGTRKICADVINRDPPIKDLPTDKERIALKGCDSASLYFGIGQKADPESARKCAIIERELDNSSSDGSPYVDLELTSGAGILAMVYANGKGAERDLDIAIHMACEVGGAPAAANYRINALDKMRTETLEGANWQGDDFHSCSDITSGLAQGICASLFARLNEQTRKERVAGLQSGWTDEQKALFDDMLGSFESYADVSNSANCMGGTAQAACAIQGKQGHIDDFLTATEAVLAGKEPPPSGCDRYGSDSFDFADCWQTRPATVGKEQFANENAFDDIEKEGNAAFWEQAAAKRRVFEPKLIAFFKSARPELTAHQVRVAFRQL